MKLWLDLGGSYFGRGGIAVWLGLGLHGGYELMDGRRNGALAGLGWATRLAVLLCGGA
jgi:hypothetical protein